MFATDIDDNLFVVLWMIIYILISIIYLISVHFIYFLIFKIDNELLKIFMLDYFLLFCLLIHGLVLHEVIF